LPRYSCKDIKNSIKKLIRTGILAPYPTSHGLDVRININRTSDVKEIIRPLEDEINDF